MKSIFLRQALLFLFFISCSLSSSLLLAKTFTFTAIPDQDQTRLKQRFNQVAKYLETELNVQVQYIPVKSYSAAITAFRNDQVQLAWFGGLSGVQARRLVPGSKAIAQGEEDQFFKTYIIANTQTGLIKAQTLPTNTAKLTFSFGAKGSTSGRLMPEYYLQKHYGDLSKNIFKRIGFSGDHSRTIALVQSGAYDLGAVNYKVWEQELANNSIDLNNIDVIWESPNYPDYQWTIRGDTDKYWGSGFSNKVQLALLSIIDPVLLNAFPRTKFVQAKSEDYKVILDTAKSIGLID